MASWSGRTTWRWSPRRSPRRTPGASSTSTRVGFEVRLDIQLDDPQPTPVHATMTRAEATAKQLNAGDRVWVKPVPGAAQIPATTVTSALPELEPTAV